MISRTAVDPPAHRQRNSRIFDGRSSPPIVQNLLLKLFRSHAKSDGNRTFSSVYLEKAACGAVVDEIRRACRRREDAMSEPEAADKLASASSGPERDSSSREIARGILACLNRLPERRKLAVTLYLYGCTVPEASTRLRWSLHRTESLVYRGLADLRHCLERRGLTP
jgi:RNA polymerase sigma-70 factor (ECF subfamily)